MRHFKKTFSTNDFKNWWLEKNMYYVSTTNVNETSYDYWMQCHKNEITETAMNTLTQVDDDISKAKGTRSEEKLRL